MAIESAQERTAQKKFRILLVEDTATTARFTIRALERRSYDVTAAANGKQALELFENQSESRPFDLIIMDCQLPVMSGFEAAEKIRAKEKLSGKYTPILAITAIATTGQKERCAAAGMDEYVNKPVHEDELITVVEQLLSKARS